MWLAAARASRRAVGVPAQPAALLASAPFGACPTTTAAAAAAAAAAGSTALPPLSQQRRTLWCSARASRKAERDLAVIAGTSESRQKTRDALAAMGGGGRVTLDVTLDDPVATLTLDHAERRNAMSPVMMAQLADQVEALEHAVESGAWSGVAVAVRGTKGAFCAGADLSHALRFTEGKVAGRQMSAFMATTLYRLRRLPLISVSLVEGAAVGGGAELCTATDHRLIADSAHVHFIHARMHVTPGWGGAYRLTQLVGPRHALRALTAAEPLSAAECVEMGLADDVFVSGQGRRALEHFLGPTVNADPAVVRAMKRVVMNAAAQPSKEQLVFERDIFAGFWGQARNADAVAGKL